MSAIEDTIKKCNYCNSEKLFSDFEKGRNQCKKCKYEKSKCEHGKKNNRCIQCNGSQLCIHKSRKDTCKECKGNGICEHNKRKTRCIECKGGSICEHNKSRTICKECKGGSICEHNKVRTSCVLCEGGNICNHKKIRNQCKDCNGKQICIHKKRKANCVICTPESSCQECKNIFVSKQTHCYPLCQACFCNKYPDHERSTLYKIKERYLRDELRERFPNNDINMIFDKAVDGGCSNKRPDVLIDLLTHSIVIECDEHQHKNYTCENKRTMQLFEDLGNRPIIFIRFNPDNYNHENGNKVEGCFKPLTEVKDMHKRRFYNINEEEWNTRISVLEKVIKEYISLDTFPSKEITEIKLFYNENSK